MSKLATSEVFLIRYNRQSSTNMECAEEFNVSEFTVRDIRQGRSWKEV